MSRFGWSLRLTRAQPQGVQTPQERERAGRNDPQQRPGARPGEQLPFGLKRQGAMRPQGGMAPRNARPLETRFQNGDTGRLPGGMNPQAQAPMAHPFYPPGVMPAPLATPHRPQPGALGQQARPAIPLALIPGALQGQAQHLQARPLQAPQWPTPHEAAMMQAAIPHALIPGYKQAPARPVEPRPQAQAWRPTHDEAAQFQGAVPVALTTGRPQGAQPQRPQAPQWPTPHEAAQFQAAVPPTFNPAARPQVPPKPPELMQWQPQMPTRPQGPARHAQGMPMAQAMPVAGPYARPQRWQQAMPHQPAPTRLPQGAYPMNVRPPTAGHQLLHPQQQQASSVPLAKLPTNITRLYQQLNLKVTSDTRPAYTNQHLMGPPSKLGSGVFNTVYAVTLKKADGSTFKGVFKPLGNEEKGWVAAATGIPGDDPQIAMRNIATQDYARRLGMDVVPDTRVAVMAAGPHAQVEGPKLGLVMALAQGNEAAKTGLTLLDRADVRAEVTNLQLLDHLTGQGDRHGNNYFIDIQNGRAKVTAIDNDQCFGHRLQDPEGIQYANNRTNYGFRGTKLPPVVDYDMAIKVNSLTPDGIRRMLGDKLSPAEVEAAVARHAGVKKHIVQLERQGRIINPGDWNQGWVTQLLDGSNSYVGRERENAIAIQAQARQAPAQQAPRQPNPGW